MEYNNELKGVLFRNDKKQSDKHPDYKGSMQVAGVEYWLSAWINERKDGKGKYMSLSLQSKEEHRAPVSKEHVKPADPFETSSEEVHDDIPF